MNEVYKKKEKLSKQDIAYLFKKGRVCRNATSVLRWDFDSAGGPLFCVTAKKNSFDSAVKRNRMRRLAKEFFRKNSFRVKKHSRIILQLGLFKSSTFREFEIELSKLFKIAGLLVDENNSGSVN